MGCLLHQIIFVLKSPKRLTIMGRNVGKRAGPFPTLPFINVQVLLRFVEEDISSNFRITWDTRSRAMAR